MSETITIDDWTCWVAVDGTRSAKYDRSRECGGAWLLRDGTLMTEFTGVDGADNADGVVIPAKVLLWLVAPLLTRPEQEPQGALPILERPPMCERITGSTHRCRLPANHLGDCQEIRLRHG